MSSLTEREAFARLVKAVDPYLDVLVFASARWTTWSGPLAKWRRRPGVHLPRRRIASSRSAARV
jgi:hypothetical protein